MLKVITILTIILIQSQSWAYQTVSSDFLIRRFDQSAAQYNQEILRIGASYSQANFGVWGKFDHITNEQFGPDYALELGGIKQYGKHATTLGIGHSPEYRLRANRLYLIEQSYLSENKYFQPFIAYIQEEYRGTPQAQYQFYRTGFHSRWNEKMRTTLHLQRLENDFSDQSRSKSGTGHQLSIFYTHTHWNFQVSHIENCLGFETSCKSSRDIYREILLIIEREINPNWIVKFAYSQVEQSSRFVEPFSGQVVSSSKIDSNIINLGLLYRIPD
jgi:hypothetical protein